MALGSTIGDLLVRIGVDASGLSTQIGAVEKRFEQIGTRMYFMGGRITQGVTVPIVAAATAVAKFGMDFDRAMTESLAIMDGVSAQMRKDMEEVAIEVSKTTKFSAKEAAEGYYHLASAGLDAAESMKALPVVAQFAQAGVMDLAKASEFLAGATAAVGLKTGDATKDIANMARVADVLTEANNKALGTIKDFAAGLSGKLGPQLRVFNKSVEEGTALLMAYAQQNIKGSAASQQAYIFLRDMARFAAQKPEAWGRNKIQVFDAQGQIKNVADIIADLTRAMDKAYAKAGDLGKVQLFKELGFTDRSRAATQYLLGMQDDIRRYQDDLNRASGSTAEVAKRQMEAVANRMKMAWHEIQAELIRVFIAFKPIIDQYVLPAFAAFADWLKRMATYLEGLSPRSKAMIAGMLALAAAMGPAVMLLGSWTLMLRAASAPIQMLVSLIKGLTAAKVADTAATVANTAANAAAARASLGMGGVVAARQSMVSKAAPYVAGMTGYVTQAAKPITGYESSVVQTGTYALGAELGSAASLKNVPPGMTGYVRGNPAAITMQELAKARAAAEEARKIVVQSEAWLKAMPAQRARIVAEGMANAKEAILGQNQAWASATAQGRKIMEAEVEATAKAATKIDMAFVKAIPGVKALGAAFEFLAKPIVGLTMVLVDFAVATVRETGSMYSLVQVLEAVFPPLGILLGFLKGLGIDFSKLPGPIEATVEMFKSLWGAVKLVNEVFEWISIGFGKLGAGMAEMGKGFEDLGKQLGDIAAEKMQSAWDKITSTWQKFREWLFGKDEEQQKVVPRRELTIGPDRTKEYEDLATNILGREWFGINNLAQKIEDTKEGRMGLSGWFKEAKDFSDALQFSLDKDVEKIGTLDYALKNGQPVWDKLLRDRQAMINRGNLVIPSGDAPLGSEAARRFDQMIRLSKMTQKQMEEDYKRQNPAYVPPEEREAMAGMGASDAHAAAIKSLADQISGEGGKQLADLAEAWKQVTAAHKDDNLAVQSMIDLYERLKGKIPSPDWIQNVADWWYSLSDAQRLNKSNLGSLWDVYEKLRKTMSAEELQKSPLEWILQDYIATQNYQEALKATITTIEELDKVRDQYKSDTSTGLSDKATDLWTGAEKASKANMVLFPGLITAPLTDQIQVFQKLGPVLDEIATKSAWDTIPAQIQVLITEYWKLGVAGKLSLGVLDKATAELAKTTTAMSDAARAKLSDITNELDVFSAGFFGRDFKGMRKTLEAEAARMAKNVNALYLEAWQIEPAKVVSPAREAALQAIKYIESVNEAILVTSERANLIRMGEGAGYTWRTTQNWGGTNVAEAQWLEETMLANGAAEAEVKAYMIDIYAEAVRLDRIENKRLKTLIEQRQNLKHQFEYVSQIASIGSDIAAMFAAFGKEGAAGAINAGISGGQKTAEGLFQMANAEDWGQMIGGGIQAVTGGVQTYQAMTQMKGRGNRALAGASYGAMVGTMFMPGIGTAIGAGIGAIGGALMKDPMWARAADAIGRQLGVKISEQTAKAIQEDAKSKFRGDQVAAEVFNLKSIIADAGGVKTDNFDKLVHKLRDAFSMLETGKFTLAQTTQVLDENFGAFADYIVKSGKVASKAFTELLDLNKRFQTESVAVKQFLSQMTQQMGAGAMSYMQGLASQFKFTVPDVSLPATGKTQTFTLDKLIQQTTTAEAKVADLKERIDDLKLTMKNGGTPRQREELGELEAELSAAEKELAYLKELGKTAGAELGPQIEKVGGYILAMFNGAIAKGADLLTVMNDLGPALDYLNQIIKATGYDVKNPAVKELLNFQQLIKDNQELVNGVAGLNQMFLALVNTGSMTQEIFDSMSGDAGEMFQKLKDAGFSEQQAMTMIAPMLSNIVKAAEQYGFKIDENTMKLILQGREMGLIKDEELTTNDILLQGLAAIIEALGGTIPAKWKEMLDKNKKNTTDSAGETAGDATDAFDAELKKYHPDAIKIKYGFESDGSTIQIPHLPYQYGPNDPGPTGPGPGPGPGDDGGDGDNGRTGKLVTMAKGGLVTAPTLAWLAEKNRPEAVIPLDNLHEMARDTADQEGASNVNVYWTVHAIDENGVEKFFNEKGLPAIQRIMRNNQFKHRTKTRESMGI